MTAMPRIWESVAPIIPMASLPNRVSPIGPGVVLDAVPDWFKEERRFAAVEVGKREILASEFCLKARFEAEGLGELCEGPGGKLRENHEVSWERIRMANLALWLARPSGIHVELVVTTEPEPGRGGTAIKGNTLESIRPRQRYAGARLTLKHMTTADTLATAIQGVPHPSSVWTAVRFLWLALTDELWEARYVKLWIAIEALFGPESRLNVGEKLRKRVARFFNSDDKQGVIARDMVDDGYDLRSEALHGSRLENRTPEGVEELMLTSEGIMLTSLRKILSDSNLISTFCSPTRDSYLDELTKGFPDRPGRKRKAMA
jgi:hypothetical protein